MKIYLFQKENESIRFNSKDLHIEFVTLSSSLLYEESIWKSFISCLEEASLLQDEKFLFCRNHTLLNHISERYLRNMIESAVKLNAKIILFNAENVDHLLPVGPDFFWIDNYLKSDLFFLDKNLFLSIIKDKEKRVLSIDSYLSKLTSNKLLANPMVVTDPITKHEELSVRMSRLTSKKNALEELIRFLK